MSKWNKSFIRLVGVFFLVSPSKGFISNGWQHCGRHSILSLFGEWQCNKIEIMKIIRWWFHRKNPQNVATSQKVNHKKKNPNRWYYFIRYPHTQNDIIPNWKGDYPWTNWSNSMSNRFNQLFAPASSISHERVSLNNICVQLIAKCFRFCSSMSGCISLHHIYIDLYRLEFANVYKTEEKDGSSKTNG